MGGRYRVLPLCGHAGTPQRTAAATGGGGILRASGGAIEPGRQLERRGGGGRLGARTAARGLARNSTAQGADGDASQDPADAGCREASADAPASQPRNAQSASIKRLHGSLVPGGACGSIPYSSALGDPADPPERAAGFGSPPSGGIRPRPSSGSRQRVNAQRSEQATSGGGAVSLAVPSCTGTFGPFPDEDFRQVACKVREARVPKPRRDGIVPVSPRGVPMKPQSSETQAVQRRKGSRPKTAGQALTEFALIVPDLMLLLLLAVDFGRLFFTYIQLNNTAREGAGYAAVNPTTDDTTLTAVALREANVQAQRGESAVAATASCVDSSGTPLACSVLLAAAGPATESRSTSARRLRFSPL